LVAIAALSRLGAVAVLMPPDADLEQAARLGGVTDIITDPGNLPAASQLPVQTLVLGGGENRTLNLSQDSTVIDMEQIDPDSVELPGWYRPNPQFARDVAYVVFNAVGGGELVPKQITNYRWALSAFGTASAAALNRNDTVYCLTPLHNQGGLLVSLGGSVVAGSRIALSRGLCPERFIDEVRQYGVTVVTYTWSMLREVIDAPDFEMSGNNPIRLFMGSGMPTGLWQRILDIFEPARIVEFFATSDGQAVLANVAGLKVGSEGRPLPGGGEVELGAYDPDEDLILEDDRGFVRVAGREEMGLLLARPWGPIDPTAAIKRGVFTPGDIWISTESVFWRDGDGDFWLLGNRSGLIRTARGVVFPAPITDSIGAVSAVDLAVTYPLEVPGGTLAVTAITLRPGMSVTAADLSEAVSGMPAGLPPDLVHVVGDLPLSASYRPTVSALKSAGLPKVGRNTWYLDADTGRYKRLTAAARSALAKGRD
jgi:putative long chain acyl-CoA synthase